MNLFHNVFDGKRDNLLTTSRYVFSAKLAGLGFPIYTFNSYIIYYYIDNVHWHANTFQILLIISQSNMSRPPERLPGRVSYFPTSQHVQSLTNPSELISESGTVLVFR